MNRLNIDVERCKGCGYCINACPKKALSKVIVEGKLYPSVEVDYSKCIACGICYQVCPDYVFSITREEKQ